MDLLRLCFTSIVMLNTYDTKVINLAITLILFYLFAYFYKKIQTPVKNFCSQYAISIFIWCNIQLRSYAKHWKSILTIMLVEMFILHTPAKISEQFTNTKNCSKLCNLAFKQVDVLFCVICETKVSHAIPSSFFLKLSWCLQKISDVGKILWDYG